MPADSMIASRPQTSSSPRRQATIGNVPAGPLVGNGGRSGPTTRSSIPPVPKVIFAGPGTTQPWPMSDACWSPAMPHTIGGAGQRGGLADGAAGVDQRRHGRLRDAEPFEHGAVPAGGVGGQQTGDGGVGDVGGVDPALGEVPQDPGVDGADAQVAAAARGRPDRAGGRPWWPTGWGPGAARRPAAPGSRRRCAGPANPVPVPTGSPVARSHTMVEARWLAMPTPSTGPASARLRRATSRAASAMAVASNSTRPGNGVDGSTSTRCSAVTDASGWTTAARTPEVPTSITRMLIDLLLRASAGPRSRRPRRPRWCRATRTAGRRRSGRWGSARPG